MIDNKSYIHIGGWMINELELKGNELLVYAVINSFTNNTKDHYFNGSLSYLSERTHQTTRNVQRCLKSLLDKGLITKDEKYENGVKFVMYQTRYVQNVHSIDKMSGEYGQNVQGGIDKMSNNIQDIYTSNIQEKETYKEKVQLDEFIEKWNGIKTIHTPKGNVAGLKQCRGATEDMEKLWSNIVKSYTREQISEGVNNYIEEIKKRDNNSSYYSHRFTLYEFIKQGNGLKKFINNI